MPRAALCGIIALALAPSATYAQLNDLVSFESNTLRGIHLYGVSAFTSYVTSAYPLNNTFVTPGAAQLGYDISYGASASVGWQYHPRENTGIGVMYSGSYNRSQNYSSLSAFGHSLRINATWQMTPKWTLSFSADGEYQTFAQYLFEPTQLGVITASPAASINDLAAATAMGQISNSQVSSMLTGTSLPASAANPAGMAATSALFGNRMLMYNTQASLSYQASSRLSFHFSGVTMGGQFQLNGSSAGAQRPYGVPRSIGLTAGAALHYSLSPRTTVGLSLEGGRTSNEYQAAYTTSLQASLARMMGSHWYLSASAGGSNSEMVQQASGTPKTRQVIGTASLGYQFGAQSVVTYYSRSSVDADGFAIGAVTTANGAWAWHRPGSAWRLFANVGRQQVGNTGFATLSGWQAAGGWSIGLPGNLALTTQYVYATDKGDYSGSPVKYSVNSVRLTIGWLPQGIQGPSGAFQR